MASPHTPSHRTVDDLVARMSELGVRHVFALSGNQNLPIFDALIGSGIEIVHVRHEAAAVHMADAWGRVRGEPGVALVAAGPGFLNALSATYVARMAESPVVLLSGHAPIGQVGQGAFQEIPQAEMGTPVCKASWTVTTPSGFGAAFGHAWALAREGRPGPVHVSLPFDLLDAPGDATAEEHEPFPRPEGSHLPSPYADLDASALRRIVDALSRCERPVLLGGPAFCRGPGRAAFQAFAEATSIPCIGLESPRGLRDPSLGTVAACIARADLILLTGKRLDFSLGFGRPPVFSDATAFIQLDADADVLEISRNVLSTTPDRLLVSERCDLLPTLARVASAATEGRGSRRAWLDEVRAAKLDRPAAWSSLRGRKGRVHPAEIGRAVEALFAEHPSPVLVSDGGEFGQWAQGCISTETRVINGPSGSIGGGIPFALGAALARPGAPVVSLIGDGTFGFHALEFDTAVRHGVRFVVVVGNDAGWNAEREIQRREFGADRMVACDLLPTRYDQVVAALGGHGEHVTRAEDLGPALERALAAGTAACVNVEIEPQAAPVVR